MEGTERDNKGGKGMGRVGEGMGRYGMGWARRLVQCFSTCSVLCAEKELLHVREKNK